MLLAAYAGAMWLFLTSAPKVYTLMVSDIQIAQDLFEGLLNLPIAQIPLHYYYDYEQTIGSAGIDPMYMAAPMGRASVRGMKASDGLWYQLKKNTQLHVISGASVGEKNRQRHVCFDRDCLEQLLMRIQTRGIKHRIRSEKPLVFLVKDYEGRIIEMSEAAT